MVVLGIDTSLRSTGIGLVEYRSGSLAGIAYDVIKNPPGRPLSASLANIFRTIDDVLEEFKPDAVAVEGIFYSKFPRTTLVLGHARGAAITAAAQRGIPVYEHEPRRVKQSVAGWGGATKEQMQKMVASMLGISALPPEDAADALAIAICHLISQERPELSSSAPI